MTREAYRRQVTKALAKLPRGTRTYVFTNESEEGFRVILGSGRVVDERRLVAVNLSVNIANRESLLREARKLVTEMQQHRSAA